MTICFLLDFIPVVFVQLYSFFIAWAYYPNGFIEMVMDEQKMASVNSFMTQALHSTYRVSLED